MNRASLLARLVVGLAALSVVPAVAAAGPGTASLVVTTTDVTGTPVGGACLELWTDSAGSRGTKVGGPRCDGLANKDGTKTNQDGLVDGVIAFTSVPAGRYLVAETRAPGDATGSYAIAADQPAILNDAALTRLIVTHLRAAAVTLHTVDGSGAALPGACFELRGGRIGGAGVCDGPAVPNVGPGDGAADGLLVLTRVGGLEKGPYTLHEMRPPDGYAAAADQTVTITATAATELTEANQLVKGGTVIVRTVDPSGTAVPGACLQLWTDVGGGRGAMVSGGLRCDALTDLTGKIGNQDGLVDGVIALVGLPAGDYIVAETRPPSDATGAYEAAADQLVTITERFITRSTLTHQRAAALTLHKVDGSGAPLPGACFELRGGRVGGAVLCDGPTVPNVGPGDGVADGLLVLTRTGGLEKGSYTLREKRPPIGYLAASDQTVTISATAATELIVADQLAKGANLIVTTTDVTGAPVGGACLELWTDVAGARGTRVAGGLRCDGLADKDGKITDQDGLVDGVIGLTGLPAGRYILTQTRAPSDGLGRFALMADQAVDLTEGAFTRLTVPHLRAATVTLHKVDGAGAPLPGACFEVRGGKVGGAALCDGPTVPNVAPGDGAADGLLVLTRTGGLEKGQYTLRETRPPDGYPAAADQTVTISATAATELTVKNELAKVGGGGTPILALDLEIDSTITIRTMTGMPLDGIATAKGTIRLEGDPASGSWSGTGTLTSNTRSKATGCPSMNVQGDGTYDWVVRSATAGPDIPADRIIVNMDSGPIVENPDAFVVDMCSVTDEGVMNTWENTFFTVHRAEFGAQGFAVRHWTDEAAKDAWTAGGPIATATWTGDCTQPLLADCHAETTFRLTAVVTGTAPAPTSAPDATETPPGGEASGAPSAKPTDPASAEPSSSNGPVPAAAGALECADLADCFVSNIGLLAAFVAATAAAVGAALLLRARGRSSIPKDVPGSRLDYGNSGIDPSLSGGPVDISASPSGGDKVPPVGKEKLPPVGMEKLPPDAGGDIK